MSSPPHSAVSPQSYEQSRAPPLFATSSGRPTMTSSVTSMPSTTAALAETHWFLSSGCCHLTST